MACLSSTGSYLSLEGKGFIDHALLTQIFAIQLKMDHISSNSTANSNHTLLANAIPIRDAIRSLYRKLCTGSRVFSFRETGPNMLPETHG